MLNQKKNNNKINMLIIDESDLILDKKSDILIEKILGMKKKLKGSFVAQCLPCKRAWVEAFQKTIEDKFNKTWYQAIIQNISILRNL
jgi:hypothetical protein